MDEVRGKSRGEEKLEWECLKGSQVLQSPACSGLLGGVPDMVEASLRKSAGSESGGSTEDAKGADGSQQSDGSSCVLTELLVTRNSAAMSGDAASQLDFVLVHGPVSAEGPDHLDMDTVEGKISSLTVSDDTSLSVGSQTTGGSLEEGPSKPLASAPSATAVGTPGSGREESWICAICHNLIPLAETAKVAGCDHHYCANCILQWCSYKSYPWCPQCRTPFESLALFKMLDGSLSDVMVEESVCLLLRAPWYVPVEIPAFAEGEEEYGFEDEEDYDDDEYYRTTLRLGNRRWGENGYVRNGRMQARVATSQGSGAGSSSGRRGGASGSARANSGSASSAAKGGSPGVNGGMGRRAKRAQKREEADKGTGVAPSRAARQPKGREGRVI